jgi:ankyrin repeat protein
MKTTHTIISWLRIWCSGLWLLSVWALALVPADYSPHSLRQDHSRSYRLVLQLRGGRNSDDSVKKWRQKFAGALEPRYAWDQDPVVVNVYVMLDGVGAVHDNVQVIFEPKSLFVYIPGVNGRDYCLSIPELYDKVVESGCRYTVREDKIYITMEKSYEGSLWPKLKAVQHLGLDDIPVLPESFRNGADVSPNQTRAQVESLMRQLPMDKEAQEVADIEMASGNPFQQHTDEEWEKKSSENKMSVMLAERKQLEDVLTAAYKGDLTTVKNIVQRVALERRIHERTIVDEFKDANGRGIVHMAAAGGNVQVLIYAASVGSDMSLKDAKGQTALFAAAATSHHDAAERLATIDLVPVDEPDCSSGCTAISHAAANGDVRMIDMLVDCGADVDANSALGTPLQWAAMADQPEAVRRLLQCGADPNLRALQKQGEDRNLPSPVVVSASMNQTQICKFMLDGGANATLCDMDGTTSLHHAAENGNKDLVFALLENGADPFAKDVRGQTPIDVARGLHGEWFADAVAAMQEGRRLDAPIAGGDTEYWRRIRGKHATEDEIETCKTPGVLIFFDVDCLVWFA